MVSFSDIFEQEGLITLGLRILRLRYSLLVAGSRIVILRLRLILTSWLLPNTDSYLLGPKMSGPGYGTICLVPDEPGLIPPWCCRLVLSAFAVLLSLFYDQGRAVRCVLPIGGGRVMHSVVLCGYQSHKDSEQLWLTNVLFDAAS